jgi:hypothetical protein
VFQRNSYNREIFIYLKENIRLISEGEQPHAYWNWGIALAALFGTRKNSFNSCGSRFFLAGTTEPIHPQLGREVPR